MAEVSMADHPAAAAVISDAAEPAIDHGQSQTTIRVNCSDHLVEYPRKHIGWQGSIRLLTYSYRYDHKGSE